MNLRHLLKWTTVFPPDYDSFPAKVCAHGMVSHLFYWFPGMHIIAPYSMSVMCTQAQLLICVRLHRPTGLMPTQALLSTRILRQKYGWLPYASSRGSSVCEVETQLSLCLHSTLGSLPLVPGAYAYLLYTQETVRRHHISTVGWLIVTCQICFSVSNMHLWL